MGEFLALLRKANGLTQQDVADKLNISNRTLSSWETDRTTPDILLLPAIADLYGVTVDELLRCERQPEQVIKKETEPQTSPLDDNYAIFNRRRAKLTFVGILSALIVLTGCIAMLFFGAPLWVDVLLIYVGAILNIVFIALIFKQEKSAKQNIDDDNRAYELTLRHETSLSLIINSLVYFAEIAVILICYCNVYYYEALGRVEEYLETYTAITVSVCAAMGIALFLTGALNNALYLNCLGDTEQKTTLKRNTKLLKKICLFGIIPIVISFIPFVVSTHVHIAKPEEPYFVANGVDEVYENFQTLHLYSDYAKYDQNNDRLVVIPKGDYFLNFQSETYIEGLYNIGGGYTLFKRFYDLGNNFYGVFHGKDVAGNESANIYYLKNGITVDDIDPEKDFSNYFSYYNYAKIIRFTAPDGEELFAARVKYFYERDGVYYSYLNNYYEKLTLTRDGDIYTYQVTDYYDYSPLLTYIFVGATAATVLVCGGIYFIKRKKQKYTF